jgi:hypothetical protein
MYLPRSHVRALDSDNMLVVGMRGAGKSFWWAALQSEPHRRLLEKYMPTPEKISEVNVSAGFGPKQDREKYPSSDIIHEISERYDPRLIWRAVVARQVVSGAGEFRMASWQKQIEWVKANTEAAEEALVSADARLTRDGRTHLVLFDSLDRAAKDWNTMQRVLRGLLQEMLTFRTFASIRLKAFVRPDMLEDKKVFGFPDASKIENTKVELTWPRSELYSLFWQQLANGPRESNVFRDHCRKELGVKWGLER